MFFQTLFHLSRLHLLQFSRLLREIGFARIVILVFVLLVFSNQFAPFIKFQSVWSGLIVLPFLVAFTGMKNEYYFFQNLDLNPWLIKLSRNVVFSLPAIMTLAIIHSWQSLLLAMVIILFTSFLPLSNSVAISLPSIFKKTNLLPWTVGLRTSFFLIAFVIALILAGILHVALLFLGIFIYHFVVLVFFTHNEPQVILEATGKRPKAFLSFYIQKHLLFYSSLHLLFLIVGGIFYIHLIPVFVIISLLLIMHQWLSVYLKFSFYEPGQSNEGMQTIQTLMFVFLFIPFTIPIPLWYLIRYRKKAIHNLETYI